MSGLVHRRGVMTLFSGQDDLYSHQVRIVIAEKKIEVDVIEVDENNKPEDLFDLNPYGTLPTLFDRDLALYQSDIIMEYLDERFPHPPMTPMYPVERAKNRLLMYRMRRDWFDLYEVIRTSDDLAKVDEARKKLTDSLTSIAPIFDNKKFFMGEEVSLLDAYILPLLWRLPSLGIDLPKVAAPLENYMKRAFARPEFVASLTDAEQELR